MRMSTGVEWSVHCLTVLAFLPEGTAFPARHLATLHDVPAAYLTKALQKLVRAGIIESVSGPKGGFRMASPPEAVSLLDVVEAVEGAEPAFQCTEIRQRGPGAVEPECYEGPCGIAAAFARADEAWRDALRATTIADLLALMPETVPPRQLEKSATWVLDVLS